MTTTTTAHGRPVRFRQSRIKMLRSAWLEYRKELVAEQQAGNVRGWTLVPSDDGYVIAIVTHA